MTQSEPFHLIATVDVDDTQRNLIQFSVKENASNWWHEFPDLWIVQGGGSVSDWRDRLQVFVPTSPSMVFIFTLPEPGSRAWAARGLRSKWAWILSNYATPNGNPPSS